MRTAPIAYRHPEIHLDLVLGPVQENVGGGTNFSWEDGHGQIYLSGHLPTQDQAVAQRIAVERLERSFSDG